MNIRILTALAITLGLIELITAAITSLENVKGTAPVMLCVLAVPWFVGAWLLARGRIAPGAIIAGLLTVLNVVSAASWTRTSALDWTVQSIAFVASVAGLVTVIIVLVQRYRAPAALVGTSR